MTFNYLLDSIKRRVYAEYHERKVATKPSLDLSFKGYGNINQVLNVKTDQLNGKKGDIVYTPNIVYSRQYYDTQNKRVGFDAPYDPTILNAVRYNYVDVSGLMVPNNQLSRQTDLNRTFIPLNPFAIIR